MAGALHIARFPPSRGATPVLVVTISARIVTALTSAIPACLGLSRLISACLATLTVNCAWGLLTRIAFNALLGFFSNPMFV
jgi:hypothetical protein